MFKFRCEDSFYQSYIFPTIFIVLLPIICFFVFNSAIFAFQPEYGATLAKWSALTVAGIVATSFALGLVIRCNIFSELLTVIKRVARFIGRSKTDVKVAWELYLYDFEEEGGVFWVHLGYIVYSAIFLLIGIAKVTPLL